MTFAVGDILLGKPWNKANKQPCIVILIGKAADVMKYKLTLEGKAHIVAKDTPPWIKAEKQAVCYQYLGDNSVAWDYLEDTQRFEVLS